MGRLLSLVRGVESSIRSRLGSWMQEVSVAGDLASSNISTLQTLEAQDAANIVQLQVDVTAPGWLSAYLTQTAWYVNSVTGNDANDASVGAPIKTLAELERRWNGRTFSSAVTAVTVSLAGTFPTEGLYLNAIFASPGATLVISGTMTQVDNGTITAYQDWNSAANLRGQLTDAVQDFTAHVRRRVRYTDGTAVGALTWIGSLGGGVTVANVGRPRTGGAPDSLFTGAFKVPSVGNAYVIETYNTDILEYQLACSGAFITLKDVRVRAPAGGITAGRLSHCYTSMGNAQDRVKLFGVLFSCADATNQITCSGGQTWLACAIEGPSFQCYGGFINVKGLCAFGSINVYAGTMMQRDSSMHDGNGTDSAHMLIEQSAVVYDQTFAAFFGNTNATQTALVRLNNFGAWMLNTCYFWGAAGNLKTNALQVGNSSGVVYSAGTVPKATGATPGVNDAVVSNVGIAWGALPYLAPSPDNGWVNVKY